jgi:hypothetical protein
MSAANGAPGAAFHARDVQVRLSELGSASILGGKLEALRGRSILLATYNQLPTGIALLELDGVARRLVLCTPDLSPEQMSAVAATAEADAILLEEGAAPTALPIETFHARATLRTETLQRQRTHATEWILLTSGTTGQPKLVVHDVMSLAGALPRQAARDKPMVWSTFYDIRRYGGLQIYLRAVLSGSALVLSSRRRDAYLGHALPLAAGADERRHRHHSTGIRPAVGRGRGPDRSRQPQSSLSAGARCARLRIHRGGCGVRCE